MNGYAATLLLALLLPTQQWLATVSGQILDREHKPLANAQITYTNVGQYTDGKSMSVENTDPRGRQVFDKTGTGRVYKAKTNKKGEFTLLGLRYGIYRIEITDASGARVYVARRVIGDNTDSNIDNTLDVDLATAYPPGLTPEGDADVAGGKLNKDQVRLVSTEHAH